MKKSVQGQANWLSGGYETDMTQAVEALGSGRMTACTYVINPLRVVATTIPISAVS